MNTTKKLLTLLICVLPLSVTAESLLDGYDDTPVSHEMGCDFDANLHLWIDDAGDDGSWYGKSQMLTLFQVIDDELVINSEKRVPIVEKSGEIYAATLKYFKEFTDTPSSLASKYFEKVDSVSFVFNFIADYKNSRMTISAKKTSKMSDGNVREWDNKWTPTCF